MNAADLATRYGTGKRSERPDSKGMYRINCPVHKGDGQNLLIWDEPKTGHILFSCQSGPRCPSREVHQWFCEDYPEYAQSFGGKRERMEHYYPQKKAPQRQGASNTKNSHTEINTPDAGDSCKPNRQAPQDIPPPELCPYEKEWGAPDHVYPLHNPDGTLFNYDYRWNNPPGSSRKQFKPVYWWDEHVHKGRKYSAGWYFRGSLDNKPLYGAVELAQGDTRPVLVVEGHKAMDAARERFPDRLVVAWQGSASSWKQTDWSPLANRERVDLWPDADKPGRDAMAGIAAVLQGMNTVAKIVDTAGLPEGHDLADPEPEGFSYQGMLEAAQVVDIVKEAPVELLPPTETWGEIRQTEFPPQKWVIDGLLPCTLSALYGAGKIGKSFLCLAMLHAIATGEKFLGRTTHQGKVLFMDYEGKQSQLQRRMKYDLKLTGPEADSRIHYMKMSSAKHNLLDPAVFAALRQRVRDIGDVRLVVIDTLERAVKSRGRGTSYQMDVDRMEQLQEWASEEEICVFFVHHTRKLATEGGEGYDDASGSRGLTGTIENNLTLKRKSGNNFVMNVQSRDVEPIDIPLLRDGVHWRVQDAAEAEAQMRERFTEQQRKVWGALEATPYLTPKLIAELTGVKPGTVKPMLQRWTMEGKLRTKADGRSTQYAICEPDHATAEQPELVEDFPNF